MFFQSSLIASHNGILDVDGDLVSPRSLKVKSDMEDSNIGSKRNKFQSSTLFMIERTKMENVDNMIPKGTDN